MIHEPKFETAATPKSIEEIGYVAFNAAKDLEQLSGALAFNYPEGEIKKRLADIIEYTRTAHSQGSYSYIMNLLAEYSYIDEKIVGKVRALWQKSDFVLDGYVVANKDALFTVIKNRYRENVIYGARILESLTSDVNEAVLQAIDENMPAIVSALKATGRW